LKTLAARILVPDLRAPWIPAATVSARRSAATSDVILSTGGASAHVVARLVRGARPWIADINDLWWRNPHNPVGPLRDRIDSRTEAGIIRSATALVVPNDARAGEIRERFGRAATTIPTGFDPAEFESADGTPPRAAREIVFAGTLYPDFNLALVFDAISKGSTTHGWSPAMVRVVFIGTGSGRAMAEASARRVDDFVDGIPPIPRPELLARLMSADALLLPLYSSDGTSLSMRFFDFVGAGRPIVAVGPDTRPAAQLIRQHALGFVCSSVEDLVSVLDSLVRSPRPPDLPHEVKRTFDLAASGPKLQRVIERAAAHRDSR
jgi:glycosyltransferase involved in cell wall biosynthesis